MSDKDVSVWDQSLFDAADVTWDFPYTKKRNEVLIRLRTESGQMNLVKTYFALQMMAEKIAEELNILDMASDEEH